MALHKQEQYRSLSECCKALYQATGKEVADDMAGLAEFSEFDKFLAEQGFRSFAPLACGSQAVALKTTGGQVLRFRHVSSPTHALKPAATHEQLQCIQHGLHKYIEYDILPQLKTDVSEQEQDSFLEHIGSKGFSNNQLRAYKGDLGRLPDGTIVSVDKDGIDQSRLKIPKQITAADRNWLIESDQESIFPYLHGTGFISKQEHFYPALRDKRVRGVLSDSDLQRLQQGELETLRLEKPECFDTVTAEDLGQFVELVKGGLYPSQAQEMLHATARGVSATPPRRGRA